jgi:hypothetical protein
LAATKKKKNNPWMAGTRPAMTIGGAGSGARHFSVAMTIGEMDVERAVTFAHSGGGAA